MIAKKVVVVYKKKSSFQDKTGKSVSFNQVCAEDNERLYLVTANNDYKTGTEIDIAYDGKKFSVIEYV